MRKTESKEKRFWRRVNKGEEHWIWTGKPNGGGYGTIGWGGSGRTIGAHVASFIIHNGHVPDGMFVLHTCDIRLCVNPGHLFLGTQLDNMRDMIAKGRQARGSALNHRPQVGEMNHGSRLSEETVLKIKGLLSAGWRQADVMRATGATRGNVWAIAHGKSWTHVIVPGTPSVLSDFARG